MFQDPLSSLVMLMEKEKVTTARDDEIRDFFNKHILPHYDFTEKELPAAREMFVGQLNQVVGDQPLLEYFNPKPDVTTCLMHNVTRKKKMDKIQLGPIKHRKVRVPDKNDPVTSSYQFDTFPLKDFLPTQIKNNPQWRIPCYMKIMI